MTGSAYAIEVAPSASDRTRYQAMGLVMENTVTLLMEAETLAGFVPTPGDVLAWASEDYTVRSVKRRVAPDGTGILYFVAAER